MVSRFHCLRRLGLFRPQNLSFLHYELILVSQAIFISRAGGMRVFNFIFIETTPTIRKQTLPHPQAAN